MDDQPLANSLDPASVRATEFAALDRGIYLNAASFSPIPERTRRVLHDFQDRRASLHALLDEDLTDAARRARSAAARLVGADSSEIALGGNASFGINLAALSLPVPPGTTVVVSDREFPANVYPWMGRDRASLEIVPCDAKGNPDEDRLLERLDRGDVSVFALSAVQFASGYRADLPRFGRFCRERGIHFVVDAIQALGQLPIDVHDAEIDILATGGHKWLCSPFGTGFVYVRRDLIGRMEPQSVGWTGMEACASLESLLDYRRVFRRDARRFEPGTIPFDAFGGMAASMELLHEIGPARIEAYLCGILDPLVAWLEGAPEVRVVSELAEGRRSGILCFEPPNAASAFRALTAAGVVCSLREGSVRIAAHVYNQQDEIERVVEILAGLRRGGWT